MRLGFALLLHKISFTMGLDKIFQVFVPKDKKFFPLFEEAALNLTYGSDALVKLMKESDDTKRSELIKLIKSFEKTGDSISHRIFDELNRSFITPFDREDIQHLASTLDDVMDFMNTTAQRIRLYKVKSLPEEFTRIAELVKQATQQINIAVNELPRVKDSATITTACIKISELENQCDDIYHETLSDMFESETNAVELIKKRDIIQALEKAADKAEDVADVIKSIIIKLS
ncbi:MAG TPA: DUF47 domain-containing protein [Bacteroidales bacterium]|nr:MAG: DUF47 domain-containing protein [Bacteroidetes bacterium HGW-Bacteroidetes-22]HAQ65817.1 DUF47 domain-containing protein [Bacteroidales bacterium]HBZ67019.1 DUF47 domain-containing protein [Bacteroidales bacterium]